MDNRSVGTGKSTEKNHWTFVHLGRITAAQCYASSSCKLLWKHRHFCFRPVVAYYDPESFRVVNRCLDSLFCPPVRLCSGFDTTCRTVFRSNRQEETICYRPPRTRRCFPLAKHNPKSIVYDGTCLFVYGR